MTFWDFLVWIFWFYIAVSVLIILFQIFADIFRDRSLNGWLKAVWVIFLVFVPFLAALIYLIARGRGMAQRQAERMIRAQTDTNAYIRTVASSGTAADDIAKAKDLLDSGAITQAEYESLKAKALA